MSFLILTVILSVVQAASPIPRQAPNNPTTTSPDSKNQGQEDKAPPGAPPLVNSQKQTDTANGHGNQQTAKNTPNTISVRELPPVTVLPAKRDLIDWGLWVFNGLLVAVGGFQIWLLVRQLKIINRQTNIAANQEKQMIAAGEQTERIIAQMKETEVRDLRAYVGVSKVILNLQRQTIPRAVVEIQNFGKTPAYKVRQRVGIFVQSYPLTITLPEPAHPQTASVSALFPNVKNVSLVDLGKPLPEATIIGTPQITIYIFGRVTYEDVFKNEWYSNYRFIFGGPDKGQVYRDERGALFGTVNPDTEGNDAT